MQAAFKFILPLLPIFWKMLGKGTKIVLTTLATVAIVGYIGLAVWATFRATLITAFDDRWYYLAKQQELERTTIIKKIQEDVRIIQINDKQKTDDIRDIRNVLMNQ